MALQTLRFLQQQNDNQRYSTSSRTIPTARPAMLPLFKVPLRLRRAEVPTVNFVESLTIFEKMVDDACDQWDTWK